MTPRVSIITTVYDRLACLQRCLRSTQKLEYRDFEQIVVSDHPRDTMVTEIASTCAEFGVQHINLPVRMNDWGISPAMAGLRAATGRLISGCSRH